MSEKPGHPSTGEDKDVLPSEEDISFSPIPGSKTEAEERLEEEGSIISDEVVPAEGLKDEEPGEKTEVEEETSKPETKNKLASEIKEEGQTEPQQKRFFGETSSAAHKDMPDITITADKAQVGNITFGDGAVVNGPVGHVQAEQEYKVNVAVENKPAEEVITEKPDEKKPSIELAEDENKKDDKPEETKEAEGLKEEDSKKKDGEELKEEKKGEESKEEITEETKKTETETGDEKLTENEKQAIERYNAIERIRGLIAGREQARIEAKNPGLFRRVKQWLDDPEHSHRRYIKIAAKVIGGAAAIGASGVLGGAPALAFAPALFGFGVKGMVDGTMEAFHCRSENSHQANLNLIREDINNILTNELTGEPALAERLARGDITDEEYYANLMAIVQQVSGREQQLIGAEQELQELKSRHTKLRSVVSSVAGIGAGLLAGFPMGMQDFDGDKVRHMVQWGLNGPSFAYPSGMEHAAFNPHHFTTFWGDGGLSAGQGYLIGDAPGKGMPLLGSLGFYGAVGGLAASVAGRYFAENRRQGRFDKVTTEQEKTTLLDSVRQEWENFKEAEINGEKVGENENKLNDILNMSIGSEEEIAAFEAQISGLSGKERENIRRLAGQSIRNTEDFEISENFNDKADIIRRIIRTGPVTAETEETIETNEQREATPEESTVEVEEPQTTEGTTEVTTTENEEGAISKEEEQQERTAEGNGEVGVASAESGERSEEEEDNIIFKKVLSQSYYDFRASVEPYPNSALRALMVFAQKERRTAVDSARGNSLQAEVIEDKVNIINEILEERRNG